METTTMGYIGYIGIILGYIGIMEKKMDTLLQVWKATIGPIVHKLIRRPDDHSKVLQSTISQGRHVNKDRL